MANLSTFLDLQDRVIAYGYSEAHRNQIKAWLNDAYRDLCRDRRWWWLKFTDTVATTAGVRTVALPVPAARNLVSVLEVKPQDSVVNQALVYEDLDADDPFGLGRQNFTLATQRGTPYRYTVDGTNIVFDPVPDRAITYAVRHYDVPSTELSADADPFLLPTAGAQALVYGALVRAASHDGNQAKFAMWNGLYADALGQLERLDAARVSQTTRRARLSPVYGRRFGV